jgi:hypothetical protein
MKISVIHRRQFGFNRFYPKDDFTSDFLEVFRRRESDRKLTFTEGQLKKLKELGFDIIIYPEYTL